MTSTPCTPPNGTREGTWHDFVHDDPRRTHRLRWNGSRYQGVGIGGYLSPEVLAANGFRYLGRVEAESATVTLTSTTLDGASTGLVVPTGPADWERMKAAPTPSPSDALLREVADWMGHKIDCAVWETNARTANRPIDCTCGRDALQTRIFRHIA